MERALLRELGLRGMRPTAEATLAVIYKGHSAGEYFADLLVEDALVVELKCAERPASQHTAQCLTYLGASGRTVCLPVNFQRPKVEWRRCAGTNSGSLPRCSGHLSSQPALKAQKVLEPLDPFGLSVYRHTPLNGLELG